MAQPDVTLDELQARLEGHGITVGRSSIGRFLNALALTRKKSRSLRPSRIDPMSPPPARTVDILREAIALTLIAFSPRECANYLANAG